MKYKLMKGEEQNEKKWNLCNCNYVELNDDQIVDINGEGFWIDVALCFVKWKVGSLQLQL